MFSPDYDSACSIAAVPGIEHSTITLGYLLVGVYGLCVVCRRIPVQKYTTYDNQDTLLVLLPG